MYIAAYVGFYDIACVLLHTHVCMDVGPNFYVRASACMLFSVVQVRSNGTVRLGQYGPSFLKIRRLSVFW